MFHQTVVRVRAPRIAAETGADATQRDWDNATRTTLRGLNVQPVVATEVADTAAISTVGTWMLSSPPGAGKLDLLSTDRVEYDGMTLEVDGPPKHWPSPSGGWHHTEAFLTAEPMVRAGAAGGAEATARSAATGAAENAWSPL